MPQPQHSIDLPSVAAVSGILGGLIALLRIIPPLHRWAHRRALERHIALSREGLAKELRQIGSAVGEVADLRSRVEELEASVTPALEQSRRIESKVDSLGNTVDRISASLDRLTGEQLPAVIQQLGQVQGAQQRAT